MAAYTWLNTLPETHTTSPNASDLITYGSIPINVYVSSSNSYDFYTVAPYPNITVGSNTKIGSFVKCVIFSYIYNGYGYYNLLYACLYDSNVTSPTQQKVYHKGLNNNNVNIETLSSNSGLTDSRTGLPIYVATYPIRYSSSGGPGWSGNSTPNQTVIHDNDYLTARSMALDAVNDGVWTPTSDPYAQADFTDKEGGTGNFDDASDPIDFPSLPTISVSDTGFVNIYNPTLTQLQNLATFMWTNPLFDLSQWRALFANPMQAILSLAILPVAIPNGGTRTIKVGNISTDVSMTLAAQQFIEFDCGSININEYWGSYLDYSPFTRLSIFLPFVGYRDLNIDECMNKTLQVKYHIDIFTGACSAFIKCGSSVLYNFSGNCAFNVPISGTDFSSVVNGILSAIGTGVTALATGGESAAFGAVASMSADVMNAKPHVQKGGSMGGNAGFLGHRTPYLILIRPRQAVPQNQNEFLGYPSFITADLANVTGYTEVINIFLQDGFTATENELNEIKRLLSEGVIL